MPEYLSPGVYVEEVASGPRPIEGVSTSNAGFVGRSERGPTRPRLVTSWGDFVRWYGGTIDANRSFLPYAVRGFFENGGQRLFVARVAGAGATPANDQIATAAADLMVVTASGPGDWGDNLMLRIRLATQNSAAPQNWFRITVLYYRDGIPNPFVDPTDPAQLANPDRREPDVLEDYDNLTVQTGRSNFVDSVVNSSSRLIQIAWDDGGGNPGTPTRPNDQAFAALANGGADGNETVVDYAGNAALPEDRRTGLAGLEVIDEISLLAAPDEVNGAIANANQITTGLVDQCERLRDRFALLNVALGQGGQIQNIQVPRDSTYGAVYFPWIRVFDNRLQQDALVPPAGHVAGVYARTDVDRGVHKAPANEVLRGLYFADPNGPRQPLEVRITKQEHDILNPRGVNVIRDFRADGRGIRVWGARTMSSDPLWRYVNVRRLFLFLEESIDEGTQWVVFEPNDEPTWAGVRRAVTNFLIRVWRSGALQGATQDEAFFVRCDRTTMTQDDIDNGRLICLIGVAPVKPAEFVIFRISQKTVGAE